MSDPVSQFAAHLERDCTTLCHCWLLERRDGVRFGFTDHDRPLSFGGQDYEPETGFTQTEMRDTLGMSVDSTDVEAALSSEVLSEDDIAAGRLDGASVRTFLVNWTAPGQHAELRSAVIGRIKRADGRLVAELESVAAYLDRPNGRHLRRGCDAVLGDARCGVSLAGGGFVGAGEVVGTPAPATVRVTGLDVFDPGWFTEGVVTWEGGATSRVADHLASGEGTFLVLDGGYPEPAIGATFTVVAGCDKRFETCKAKFGNAASFRGFPHLPGNDAAYGYVANDAVHDGKAIVP